VSGLRPLRGPTASHKAENSIDNIDGLAQVRAGKGVPASPAETGGGNRRYINVMLAAYVAVTSARTLLGHRETKTTYLGITILIGAAAIMPWPAQEKRKLSATTGSDALRADVAESALCAYLSVIALF